MTLTVNDAHPAPHAETAGQKLLADIRGGSVVVWWTIIAFGLLGLACVGMQFVDTRLIHGASVWDKPAKFYFSLAIQFATVSWALTLLPQAERNAKSIRRLMIFMVACGWMEMAYIVLRAARAEASHFNTGEPIAALLYSVMGVAAVSMTLIAGYVGLRLWRHRKDGIWTEAAAVGLILGTVLGTFAGAYMSAQTSHWVGGAATDANGLGFFSWSTSGGDLRVAHFIGLHAAQFIPLAALSHDRRVVYGVAIGTCVATLGIFVMGIVGLPVLRG